ncbi:polysaccharide transporter, PST family [Flavimobilis marinus]|uniref:Polysaccharide transporter, PST family n=1 Tax=Flavimobilis marinus TaxID=285351 RepID=A0A1I2I8L8_9MICO|nr:polysaccharide transporter, PST family [Flavimobilis marinus]
MAVPVERRVPGQGRVSASSARSPGLGSSAARGAVVTVAGQGARMILQIASVIVLARFLDPHEYGLVTMVLVVVGIGEIFRDFGLSTAAVRAATVSPAQRSNLFWANTGLGVLLGIALLAAAPLLGRGYGEPDVVPIARALAVVFVLNGLLTQYRADLNRRLRFTVLAATDVSAQAVGFAVAVMLAVNGAGAWALVAQQVTQAAVLLVIVAVAAGWLPRGIARDAPMREFWHFGVNLVGSQVIGYLGNNIDSIVIGARLGAGPLGLYNRGYTLVMTPVRQVRAPSTTVAVPVLSRLVTDPPRFARFVTRGQLALAYPVMIGVAVLVGVAAPATVVLLGPAWVEVAPIIQLLAVAALFQTLAYVGYWVYLVCGLTPQLLRYSLVSTALKIALVLLGAQWGGVVGVAAGYLVASAIEWPLSLWWLARLTPFPGVALTWAALRIVTVGAVVAAAAYGGAHAGVTSDALASIAGVAAGLASFGMLALVVRPVRRDVRAVLDVARLAVARAKS